MAQTYTVIPWSNMETEGDQFLDLAPGAAGSIDQPMLAIIPSNLGNNVQFTVSREDFGITSGTPTVISPDGVATFFNGTNDVVMPEEVEYVTMEDTATPGTPGNVIAVKVFLVPTFVMPNSDYTINIDITGNGVVYDPISFNNDGGNYVFGIYLTNGMWPGGNSFYAPPIYGVPASAGVVPYYDQDGVMQFGIANYTNATAESWNEYEAQGKQNPYAIPNCVIQQINSPVQAAVGDDLDINGNGYSWVTQSTDGTNVQDSIASGASVPIPCYYAWEIRPSTSAFKISMDDFSIMTRDVKQMVASYAYDPAYDPNEPQSQLISNTQMQNFPAGFAYYKEWENNNPYLNLNNCPQWDLDCTDAPSEWQWNFPSDISIDSLYNDELITIPVQGIDQELSYSIQQQWSNVEPFNSISDSSGLGNAQLTPPTNYNSLYTEDDMPTVGTSSGGTATYMWWPGISDKIGIFDGGLLLDQYWGNDETFGNCDEYSAATATWVSVLQDLNATAWQDAWGGGQVIGFQKYFSKVMVFVEDNPGGSQEIDPDINMANDSNMNNGYINPYGPPPISKLKTMGNAEEEADVIYNGGNIYPNNQEDFGLNDKYPGCFNTSNLIRMVTMHETNPGEDDNKIIVMAFPCQNAVESAGLPGTGILFNDNVNNWMRRVFLQINGKATSVGQGLPPIDYDIDVIDTGNSGTISIIEEPE